jgi:hypothetical protein
MPLQIEPANRSYRTHGQELVEARQWRIADRELRTVPPLAAQWQVRYPTGFPLSARMLLDLVDQIVSSLVDLGDLGRTSSFLP